LVRLLTDYLEGISFKLHLDLPSFLCRLCIAECHARLSLRNTVTEQDALAAILLYEESMVGMTGVSTISVGTEPHWDHNVLDYYLTQQVQKVVATMTSQYQPSVDQIEQQHAIIRNYSDSAILFYTM